MNKKLPEKKDLASRLATYAASTGALLAIGVVAKGQVIYSGIQNLQIFMPLDSIDIDLNGDMVSDFAFAIYGTISSYTYGPYNVRSAFGWAAIINPKTDSYKNSWITRQTITDSYSYYYNYNWYTYFYYSPIVDGLGTGVQVDSLQTMWSNLTYPYNPGALGVGGYFSYTGPASGYSYWGYGDFFGDERYIGVRFYIGTEQHYGWIRASLGELIDPLTIIDWAYEDTPGIGILTGAGDVTGPQAHIDFASGVTNQVSVPVEIFFDERAFSFELSDIDITNGFAADFQEIVPGLHFTIMVTAASEGEVTITLPAGIVTDQLGNENMRVVRSYIYDDPSTTPINNISENGFNIYPNPVNGNLHVDLEHESALRIVSMNGDIVYSKEHVLSDIIDMSGFVPGIYFVQVENDKTVKQHKLIVE